MHCNRCRMEHLGYENLSLCILSIFSVFNGRIYFLSILLSVFQIAANQPLSKSFCTGTATNFPLCLRNIKWHCVGGALIVLWHAITKYIFRRLDKQWHQCFNDLITHNIATVLSIITWHFIRDHHLVYIDRKYIR